ncbi:MAG: 50S ribosomal protein L30 [Oscillospiraceae bacterium]
MTKAAPAGKVTIKLVKSLVGRIQNQKDCASALGLKKVGDVTVQPDNTATKGKIVKISHLVEVTK